MFLIPYRWFWITSPLTEDEVKRRISAQVEWHETGSRVRVMIAAPEFVGFLVFLPLYVAFVTVKTGFLAGAAAIAGSILVCLAFCFYQGGLLKDLQQMLSGAPSL